VTRRAAPDSRFRRSQVSGNVPNLRGVNYDCSCNQPFEQIDGYPAKWIDSELRLEMALGFDECTGKQKAGELREAMKNTAYTPRDAQPGIINQQDKNQK
jgi:hypothetical protein